MPPYMYNVCVLNYVRYPLLVLLYVSQITRPVVFIYW